MEARLKRVNGIKHGTRRTTRGNETRARWGRERKHNAERGFEAGENVRNIQGGRCAGRSADDEFLGLNEL